MKKNVNRKKRGLQKGDKVEKKVFLE